MLRVRPTCQHGERQTAPPGLQTSTLVLTHDAATTLRDDHEHFALLRAAVAEHGGRELQATDDELMVVFASAVAGVRCAIAMRGAATRIEGGPALRVGLAAGEPLADGDDRFGPPVVVASRLCDVAAAGQILVSDVARQVARGLVQEQMAPAGSLRLRGVEERMATAEVCWRDDEPVAEPPVGAGSRITAVGASGGRSER